MWWWLYHISSNPEILKMKKAIRSIMNFMFYSMSLLVVGFLMDLMMIQSGLIRTLNSGSILSNFMISKKSLIVSLVLLMKKHLLLTSVSLPLQYASQVDLLLGIINPEYLFQEKYLSDWKKAVNLQWMHAIIWMQQNKTILLKWFLRFLQITMKVNSPMIVPFSQLMVKPILDMSGMDSSRTFRV